MIRLDEPLGSLDPVEWSIYADNLEDHDAPVRLVRRARRVAKALERTDGLILLGHVGNVVHLHNNPFRVGHHLFVVQSGTILRHYRLTWRPLTQVRKGFARWNAECRSSLGRVIRFAHGTCRTFPHVRDARPEVVASFYRRLARTVEVGDSEA
jgi:hypothetical protein